MPQILSFRSIFTGVDKSETEEMSCKTNDFSLPTAERRGSAKAATEPGSTQKSPGTEHTMGPLQQVGHIPLTQHRGSKQQLRQGHGKVKAASPCSNGEGRTGGVLLLPLSSQVPQDGLEQG